MVQMKELGWKIKSKMWLTKSRKHEFAGLETQRINEEEMVKIAWQERVVGKRPQRKAQEVVDGLDQRRW